MLRDILGVVVPLMILLPFCILVEQVSPLDRYSLRDRITAAIPEWHGQAGKRPSETPFAPI